MIRYPQCVDCRRRSSGPHAASRVRAQRRRGQPSRRGTRGRLGRIRHDDEGNLRGSARFHVVLEDQFATDDRVVFSDVAGLMGQLGLA